MHRVTYKEYFQKSSEYILLKSLTRRINHVVLIEVKKVKKNLQRQETKTKKLVDATQYREVACTPVNT